MLLLGAVLNVIIRPRSVAPCSTFNWNSAALRALLASPGRCTAPSSPGASLFTLKRCYCL